MYNKIKSTALALLVATSSTAALNAASPVAYVGAKFGYGTLDSRVSTNTTDFPPALAAAFGDSDKSDLSGRGIDGGLILGAGLFFGSNNCIFAGLEASGALSNLSGEDTRSMGANTDANTVRVKKKYDFDLLFKLGYTIAETAMPYLIVGASFAKFELQSSFQNITVPAAIPDSSVRAKKMHTGLVIGAGIDVAVTDCFDVGLQAAHKRYNSKTLTHELDGASVSYRVKPRSNEVHLTAKWKFYKGNA